jgi:hypothetical protein
LHASITPQSAAVPAASIDEQKPCAVSQLVQSEQPQSATSRSGGDDPTTRGAAARQGESAGDERARAIRTRGPGALSSTSLWRTRARAAGRRLRGRGARTWASSSPSSSSPFPWSSMMHMMHVLDE